jgi:hypothetical protein
MELSCCWIVKDPNNNFSLVSVDVIKGEIPEAEAGPDGSIFIPTEWDMEIQKLKTKRRFTFEHYDPVKHRICD